MNIDKLIEARKRWNQLSDCIYELAAGDLDNSRFNVIYQNYEDEIRDNLMTLFPKHCNFLAKYFDLIILTWANSGEVAFLADNKEMRIRKGIDFYNMLADNNHIEYEVEGQWAW